MEMISVDFPPRVYTFLYPEAFLNPVFEFKTDGVTLLKIWKNDKVHSKKGYINEKEEENIIVAGGRNEGFIKVSLAKPSFITRLEVEHEETGCNKELSGNISYSLDNENEQYAPDELYNAQGGYAASLQTTTYFVYFFPAYPARFIQLKTSDPNSCLLHYKNISVKSLKDINP